MAFFDLALDELRAYKPAREEPADFDAFWRRTLAEASAHPLDASFTPVDCDLQTLDAFDVTFAGYGGQPVKGWLMLPRQRAGKLPCVVEFIGYGGGRGYPIEWLHWASSGFAHLVMDTRGQGSAWRKGDTPDLAVDGANPSYPGFMTQGILSPETYYYRRVFTDGVRAVAAARSHPAVDGQRVAVHGGSQGGGITLAVTALADGIAASLPDVPFLCHYRRAVTLVDTYPYKEIAQYCKVHRDQEARVFETLSYFDGMNFAVRAKAPALFSTSQMDDICPPSTVFAAYNHYAGPKEISVYTFNGHEGGEVTQRIKQVKFLKQALA